MKKTHNNKKRWFVNELTFTINKVNENLKPSKPYIDDSGQTKLPFGDTILDVSVEMPLVIGYIPSLKRNFIKAIHIIKYKNDGTPEWSIPIYEYQNSFVALPIESSKHDIAAIIKIKSPKKKVIELFDKD